MKILLTIALLFLTSSFLSAQELSTKKEKSKIVPSYYYPTPLVTTTIEIRDFAGRLVATHTFTGNESQMRIIPVPLNRIGMTELKTTSTNPEFPRLACRF